MEKKYRKDKDIRNGKTYYSLKKTKKQQEKERDIINDWCNKNLANAETYEHVSALFIYTKFIKDSGLDITLKSFGNYLKFLLPKLGFRYMKFFKQGKDLSLRSHYFALKIKNEAPEVSFFNIKRSNLSLFGKELSRFFVEHYPHVQTKIIVNSDYITKTNKRGVLSGYTCIKIK